MTESEKQEAHERIMHRLRTMTRDEVIATARAAGIIDDHGQLCWPYRDGDEAPPAR